jgi:hypothetical protein
MKNGISLLLSCAAFLFVAAGANASVIQLNSLNAKLKTEGAGWTARKSWVTDLSRSQLDRLLGYKQKVRIGKDVVFSPKPGMQALDDDSIDWRNHDGQDWVSPILNQGNCGSCVAFATVGTLETQMNISHHTSWLNPHYSTEALFSCGGGGCDYGWYPGAAASYLQTTGVPDDACAPYTMGATGRDASCSSVCPDAASRSQKISKVLEPQNVEEVKAALQHGPLMTTMDVYADFIAYGSGVYRHTTGDYLGGHAVSIVGYNDAGRYWIVRNSWGEDWGENGFFRVSYDDQSGIGMETWGFDVPDTQGVAALKNLADHQFLSGNVNLEAESTIPGTTAMSVEITGNNKDVNLSCQGTSCEMPLATGQYPDGRYMESLAVKTGNGNQTVEKKYFYIVNHKPDQLQMTFQPQAGLDLKQPVKDRIVFDVSAVSSSVPFSSLSFIAKQNGKVVNTRSADIVLPQMTMGWRTTAVPNGTYDIYLMGKISAGATVYTAESNHFTVVVDN